MSATSRTWGDSSLLRVIKNPVQRPYTIVVESSGPEVTFMGAPGQPDFAAVKITYAPRSKIIELKSLKLYWVSFRCEHVSYERFIHVVYDALWQVMLPEWLQLEVEFLPRGGMASRVAIDSRDLQHLAFTT